MTRRRRSETGAAALIVAILLPLVFLACAAFAVDVSRWYLERQQLQSAADAAALAAVPFMPYDLVAATTRAREVAARNGFNDALADVEVAVTEGGKPAQLRVVITARLENTFGAMIGADSAVLNAVAVADYQGPAPMGSPCNTFGNEPPAGAGLSSPQPTETARGAAPLPNCTTQPQLWAMAEGPQTGKVQGDRYQTRGCESSGVDGCTSAKVNTEYDEFGHVFVVKVEPEAVNHTIDLQLYDPMFVNTGQTCALLPSSSSFVNLPTPTNLYVNDSDARNRYARNGTTSAQYCSGDSFPGVLPNGNTVPSRVVTSFVMRQQTDSQEPQDAPVQTDVGGSPCIRQYGGYSPTRSGGDFNTISANVFKLLNVTGYLPELGETFHNWTSFCRFTPTRAGDYYLQVRTNVSLDGTGSNLIKSGNSAAAALIGNTTTGAGANSFAIRAVTDAGLETKVAVSGYDHMPIYVNAPSAVSTFNLLRVLPGAAGRRISFEFFDAADAASGSGGGTVQVTMPTEATYTGEPFPGGCLSKGGGAGSGLVLTNCIAPVSSSTNNGKVQQMTIPIPNDYMCAAASLGGCWYRVTLSFPGVAVTDVTTWDARIEGDPVRLIE